MKVVVVLSLVALVLNGVSADSIPSPPPISRTSGISIQNVTSWLEGLTSNMEYEILAPRYWVAKFPHIGPHTQTYKALYDVYNVSYDVFRNNYGTPYRVSRYGVLLNDTCTVSVYDSPNLAPTGLTGVKGPDQYVGITGVKGPDQYVGSNIPCDVVGGSTCRVWTFNTSFVHSRFTNIDWEYHYFATDSDTLVGARQGYYDIYNNNKIIELFNIKQILYLNHANKQQAQQVLPINTYTLPDACKAIAQDGFVSAAFDSNSAHTVSVSIPTLLLLGAATLLLSSSPSS